MILLIEDDYEAACALCHIFVKGGFEVRVAGSQEYAMHLILSESVRPDVICISSPRQRDLLLAYWKRANQTVPLILPEIFPIHMDDLIRRVKRAA